MENNILQKYKTFNSRGLGIDQFFYSEGLTKKEIAIAICIFQSKPTKLIADELGLTTQGVKFHITHIYKKMKVQSRSEFLVKTFKEFYSLD